MSQKVSGTGEAGRATMRQPPGWEHMDEVSHCGGFGAEETGTVHGTGATLDLIIPARHDIS
ncbi:unnamed protein product [Fusarium venenatum]|uniref:Uncharacterized protein n=1 Tax=Fusarium venenatum TaxID=56646 RepID=A0A2L2SYX1_9HYPO|nr:uncharacterized protein FVRRES_11434 [Fusarium venenatum]CEI38743.1 unnamed protein product [Fusarium venenatum]